MFLKRLKNSLNNMMQEFSKPRKFEISWHGKTKEK